LGAGHCGFLGRWRRLSAARHHYQREGKAVQTTNNNLDLANVANFDSKPFFAPINLPDFDG